MTFLILLFFSITLVIERAVKAKAELSIEERRISIYGFIVNMMADARQ